MQNIWLISAVWTGFALGAAVLSSWTGVSVALAEIIVGVAAGNTAGLPPTPWVNFLAGFGAILLTFLAGAEIDPFVVRRHFRSSITIGMAGFLAPYAGALLFARYAAGWPWPQAQIAGISLSTTSVAVVYAVMIETGFNRTEIGKLILAACFVNDLGTVLALGLVFAHYNLLLAVFAAATVAALWLLWRFAPALLQILGDRVSEPQTKFVALVLLLLGGLASIAGSEAVLPAYLVGMVLAPVFLKNRELPNRMRIVAFTSLGPVRTDEPHHQPAAIHDPCHRRDRQRDRSHTDRAAVVRSRIQGDRSRWGRWIIPSRNPEGSGVFLPRFAAQCLIRNSIRCCWRDLGHLRCLWRGCR